MKKSAFRKLIKLTLEGLIRESEPDDELEGKPFDDDDIWPGSDIGGVKQGGTGFSHGQGYPNNPFRRRGRKMTKDDLRKILFINNLEGVKDEDKEKFGRLCQRLAYQFIKKNAPWIFTYGYKEEHGDKMWYPFAPYFSNQYQSFDYWLNGFSDVVSQQLDSFEHWIKFPKEQLKGAAKYNRHWILRYKWAREMMKQHPTLVQDLSKVKDLVSKLYRYSPEDATNDKNYPAYVTLYDTTRRLGGHEEGGWWYDDDDMVDSVKVSNYKDARKAALHFLKSMGSADLNGKPLIVLEKEQGSRGNKPPPSYS
jgi:hypothetical protein